MVRGLELQSRELRAKPQRDDKRGSGCAGLAALSKAVVEKAH